MHILVSTVVAALCLAAFTVGSVSAAPNSIDKAVHIVGGETFSPDEFFSITYHFTPRRTRVHRGDNITWENQTTDGHTVSVVTREQLPKTVQQIDNCSVCNDLLAAHFPNGFPPQGTPVLVLDDFKATTAPADSIVPAIRLSSRRQACRCQQACR
jgi:plastocyanin